MFLSDIKQEIQKITWPTSQELLTSTLIILIVVILFGIASLILDYAIHNLISFLLKIGK